MARRKDYDDNELVRLIARGELTGDAIAKRLGMKFQFVSEVATGRKRPDLQPKIQQAMRQFISEAWKNGGVLSTEDGQPRPRPTSGRSKQYDDNLLIELLGAGELTFRQIARRIGLTKEMVWGIATGRKRPDLQPRIREAQKYYRKQAQRIGSKWSAQLMMKQIEVGLKNNGWVGLRARQHLLDRFLGRKCEAYLGEEDNGKSDDAPRPLLPMRSLAELSLPLRAAVLKELGGPELGPEDYEAYAAAHGGGIAPPDLSGEALAKTEDTSED